MHTFEGVDEIRYQRSKYGVMRWAAGNQYVVEIAPRVLKQNVADCGFEAPLDTIALHRPSNLLADREAKPRFTRLAAPPPRLQHECM